MASVGPELKKKIMHSALVPGCPVGLWVMPKCLATRCHKCVATCFSICASHSICMNVRLATTTKLQNSLKMKWGSWPSQHKHRCFLYLASNTIQCIGTFEKESGLTIRLLFQRYAKRLHSACYGADNEGPVRNILVIGLQSGPQDGNRSSQV